MGVPPRGRHIVTAVLMAAVVAPPSVVLAQGGARSPRAPDVGQRLAQVEEVQRAIDQEIGLLRAQLQGLETRLNDIQTQMKEAEEGRSEDREQLKAMREEVRGLYVESSSTKELIGNLGEQIDGLGTALERFRLGAGVLLAALVVLQGIGIVLMFRARG